jgi:CysZ protein
MIFIVIIALTLEFFFLGLYWIIAAITGIHFLDDIIYFLIAAFFYGFSFYDYSLERYELGVFKSLRFAFSNIFLVSISGCIFLGLYTIPYLGVIIAPVLSTMIATIVYLKQIPINLNPIK